MCVSARGGVFIDRSQTKHGTCGKASQVRASLLTQPTISDSLTVVIVKLVSEDIFFGFGWRLTRRKQLPKCEGNWLGNVFETTDDFAQSSPPERSVFGRERKTSVFVPRRIPHVLPVSSPRPICVNARMSWRMLWLHYDRNRPNAFYIGLETCHAIFPRFFTMGLNYLLATILHSIRALHLPNTCG